MAAVFDGEPIAHQSRAHPSHPPLQSSRAQQPPRSRAGSRVSTVSSAGESLRRSKSVSAEEDKVSDPLRRLKTVGSDVKAVDPGPFATTLAQHLESDYEEIWVRSTAKRPKRQLIYVIPGIPSLVRAYVTFTNSLARRQGSDVCVVGHLGHCTFSRQVFDLASNVAHHRRVLKKHSKDYPKVLVLGHSIGGYIALQLSDTLQGLGDKLIAVGLLAPVLARFASRAYWTLRVFSTESFMPTLQQLVKYMPNRGTVPSEFRKAVVEGQFLANVMSLVRDCLSTLTDDLPRSRLTYWGMEKRKLFVIYAADDRYTTPETQRSVRYCAEPMRSLHSTVTILGTIRHNFVLFPDQALAIADLIDTWIRMGKFAEPKVEPPPERFGFSAFATVATAVAQVFVQPTIFSGERWRLLCNRFSSPICLKRAKPLTAEPPLRQCHLLRSDVGTEAATLL